MNLAIRDYTEHSSTELGNDTTHYNGLTLTHWVRHKMSVISHTDGTLKRIFLIGNVRIVIIISLKFVPKGPINNIPALVQIMARRWPDDKPLSETMMVRLLTYICATRSHLKSPKALFYQQHVHANNNKNIKVTHCWVFVREDTLVTDWFPSEMASNVENAST